MRTIKVAAVLSILGACAAACTGDEKSGIEPPTDTGTAAETSAGDTAATDDTGRPTDTGTAMDTATPDTAIVSDSGGPDATVSDSGAADTAVGPDTSVTDTGTPDTAGLPPCILDNVATKLDDCRLL